MEGYRMFLSFSSSSTQIQVTIFIALILMKYKKQKLLRILYYGKKRPGLLKKSTFKATTPIPEDTNIPKSPSSISGLPQEVFVLRQIIDVVLE